LANFPKVSAMAVH